MSYAHVLQSLILGLVVIGVSLGQERPPRPQVATAAVDPLVSVETPLNTEPTALDRYVATPDPTYEWKVIHQEETQLGTVFIIDMKSQTWLRPDEVDRNVWQHWLTVFKPRVVDSNKALLLIAGGANGKESPKSLDPQISTIAAATRTVVAEIKMIPNQPLIFHGDGIPRTEDDLIGYTWDYFLKTGDERWPARLPMVKSVVRAMDTIEALMATDEGGNKVVNQFIVAGGSKRGWTTWMTAAVDKRVVGIAPIVIDVLNVDVSMRHHYAAYGFWAEAIGDYVHHKIMDRRNTDRYYQLLKLVDPFAYRDRFTMPKCIINATGDQFFCPDSSHYYFDELPGEKHLCYVPNSEHSLKGTDAIESLIAFHYSIVHDLKLPKFDWKIDNGQLLTVRCETQPQHVYLWTATNPKGRDFRVDTIGRAYESVELHPNGGGSYATQLKSPNEGWSASFVQCEFDIGAPTPIRLTTDVFILPDLLPHLEKPIPVIE
ncbi:MAG: PhoPQ-activated pathogenicity-related family protein [Planctomycetales bacterium]|nr:PhoPQ-activated pathogenicity-related family protein [Planctomycetales bacterium]